MEFLPRKGIAQARGAVETGDRVAVHALVEEAERPAALALDVIHGGVGLLQQGVESSPSFGNTAMPIDAEVASR